MQILIYIVELFCIFNFIVSLNILVLDKTIASILVLLIYALLAIIYRNQKVIQTITAIFVFLPYTVFVNSINVLDEVKIILNSAFWLYITYLICNNLIKTKRASNMVASIITSLILIFIMFNEGLYIGLYVGVVALILILISFINKEYKGLFTIGIAATIVNIIYQLRELWNKVPFWLYLLLAGLTIIAIVTVKQFKKLSKVGIDKDKIKIDSVDKKSD